jgi:hypothetical protein
MTGARAFALAGLGLAIVGAVGTVIVRFVAPAPFIGGLGFGPSAMAGYVIAGLTWASIGALLVVRRRENAVGWLMVVLGVGYSLSQLSVSLTFAFAAEGTVQGDRLAQIAGWVTVMLQLVTILQFAIAFLFPTGRPQSPGWARFMGLFWAFTIVFVVTSLTQPGSLQLIPALQNPFGFGPDLRGDRPIAPLLAVITLIVFASLGLSMVTRYRSAGRIERQQLKWFVLASGLSAIALGIVTWEGIILNRPGNTIGLTVYVFAGAVAPVAIGIAILRYHLFDIDRIVSRAIAYGLITAILVAAYAGIVIVIGGPLGDAAGGDSISVALSTLAVAALFQPVRRRIQAIVDRRFDRARIDAERTTAAFSERLRDEVDIETVTTDLALTATSTVAPSRLAIWLRPRAATR